MFLTDILTDTCGLYCQELEVLFSIHCYSHMRCENTNNTACYVVTVLYSEPLSILTSTMTPFVVSRSPHDPSNSGLMPGLPVPSFRARPEYLLFCWWKCFTSY